jgi:phage gp29-like protein
MAEKNNKEKEPKPEVVYGYSGTKKYGGFITQDFNTEWNGHTRAALVDKMRSTDGTVASLLRAVKTPILSTNWRVEGDDDNKKAIVEESLFNMKRSFEDFMREGLAHLDFGHYVFEVIYEVREGVGIVIKDLAPRIPQSIMKWEIAGGEAGITQYKLGEVEKGRTLEIPMNKLLVLTNDMEGDDLSGRSILRPVYKHWSMKDIAYRVGAIATERYGVGVPTMIIPPETDLAKKQAYEDALKNIHSNEQSYMLLLGNKEEIDFSIKTPDGNGSIVAGMKEQMSQHDQAILRSGLAGFLGLGSDGTGSFALSKDLSSFFLKRVEEVARYMQKQIQVQVIHRLMDLNYGDHKDSPQLVFDSLGDLDFKEFAEVLQILIDSGLADADDTMREHVAKSFKIPMPEGKAADVVRELKKKDKQLSVVIRPRTVQELAEYTFRPFRDLTAQEERVNVVALNEEYNRLETELEDVLIRETERQAEKVLSKVQDNIEKDGVDVIDAITFAAIQSVLRKKLRSTMIESYNKGKARASSEMGEAQPPSSPEELKAIRSEADDIAEAYVANLEGDSRSFVRDLVLKGAAASAIVSGLKVNIQDGAARMITNVSGSVVGQNINRGRSRAFLKNATQIVAYQRSEILDDRTCAMCMSLDERVIEPTDPMAKMDLVHTHCRGFWVPIMAIDDNQPKIGGIPESIKKNFKTVDGKPRTNAFKQIKKPIVSKQNKKAVDAIRNRM